MRCYYKADKHCKGTVITVSIPKFLYGNNLKNISPDEVRHAIEELSKLFNYDFRKAKIRRLDFGLNIEVPRPVKSYWPTLGQKLYFKRVLAAPTSSYYKTEQRELQFYDKLKEMKNRKQAIPQEYESKNILRIELRFRKRVQSQFKKYKRMTAAVLFQDKFFQDLGNVFMKEISFAEHKTYSIPQGEFKPTPNGALDMCLILISETKAPPLYIQEYVNTLRSVCFLSANRGYNEVERKLKGMLSTTSSERIENIVYTRVSEMLIHDKSSK